MTCTFYFNKVLNDAVASYLKVHEAKEQPTLKSTLHGAVKSKLKKYSSLPNAKVQADT